MTIGSGKSLTDAIKIALAEMVTWLEDDFKISRWERLQVVSQGGQIRVGNVVSPSCTAALKLSKNILF
jgi:acetamidase/formamidase